MSEQALAKSTAEIQTEHASKYLQQLCKHFAHKRPVTFDEQAGTISLMSGDCHLRAAGPQLQITVAAPEAEQLAQLEDVVVRHLIRFAFREELQFEWVRD